MNRLYKYKFYSYVLVFILATSCVAEKTNEDIVKRIVSKYVSFVPAAYRYGDFESLREVAADKALAGVSETYDAFRHGKSIILKSELQSLVFNEIILGTTKENTGVKAIWFEEEKEWKEVFVSENSIVKTSEVWVYNWVNTETGEPASPLIKTEYDITYTLKWAKSGTMKVVSVDVAEETVVESIDTGAEWDVEDSVMVHGMRK